MLTTFLSRVLGSFRSARSSPASSGAVALCYHHIGDSFPEFTDRLGVTTSLQELQNDLVFLHKNFQIVSVPEVAASPERKELVAVTFDDGYRSVILEALPLIEEFQIPVSLYLNYGAVAARVTWLNKLNRLVRSLSAAQLSDLYHEALGERPCSGSAAKIHCYIHKFRFPDTLHAIETWYAEHFPPSLPPDLFMSDSDILALKDHPLITWGSHSCNHYPLHRLPPEVIRDELEHGHSALHALLDERLKGCALPFGNKILRQHEAVIHAVSSLDPYFVSCTGEPNPGREIGDLRELCRFPSSRGMAYLRRRAQRWC